MPSPHQLSRRRRRTRATSSPAGRAGITTSAAPVDGRTSAETTVAPGKPTAARRWRLPLPVALGVLTVILGGLAAWSGLEAQALRGGAAARNAALTDNARTSEVKGAVTSAVNA